MALYHGRLIKMGGQFLKALLILCICCTQHCVSFGTLAGSEIRANRAPITCFPNPLSSSSESRRYNSGSSNSSSSSSGSDGSTVGATEQPNDDDDAKKKKNQLEQNTKYVDGLIGTLESLLDQYVVSGSMPTVRYHCSYVIVHKCMCLYICI